MIFVNPWQYTEAIIAVGEVTLKPDHMIFSSSMEYLVEEVLEQHGTWVRDRSALHIHDGRAASGYQDFQTGAEDGEEPRDGHGPGVHSWRPFVLVKKTFVCLAPVRSSAITTASSTDVHNRDANPRRVELPEL